jgi:uncharacterized protein (DUF2141 family)
MKTQRSFPAFVAIGLAGLAPIAQAGELTVSITNIRTDKGELLVSVVNSDAGWNNQAKPVAATKVAATGKDSVLRFDLPAGSYAVQVMHDENGNGKLDTNFIGIPSEGYGFSNNPQVMRKAYFSEAKFEIGDAAASIVINLR